MDPVTYVLFAPKAKRSSVRNQLQEVADDSLRWTERKKLLGSEFIISGPPGRAREAHRAAAMCLVQAGP
jgi:hypothetical protein